MSVDLGRAWKIQDGIDVWPLFADKDAGADSKYILGHAALDRYIVVDASKLPIIRQLIGLLDGTRTRDDINAVMSQTGVAVDSGRLITSLHSAGLLEGVEPAPGDFTRHSITLKSVDLSFGTAALSGVGALFAQILGIAIMMLGVGVLAAHWDLFCASLKEAWLSHSITGVVTHAVTYACVTAVCVVLHEAGHAAAAGRHGLLIRKLTFALYLGIVPMCYLRIPGLYTLRPRKRIYIWSAGIYVNGVLAACGAMCLAFVRHVPFVLAAFVVVNYSLIFANVLPFLPTDGYFIGSTLLKVHNVRGKAITELKRALLGHVDLTSWIYLCYGLLSTVALVFVLSRDAAVVQLIRSHPSPAGYTTMSILGLSWSYLLWKRCRDWYRSRSGLASSRPGIVEKRFKGASR